MGNHPPPILPNIVKEYNTANLYLALEANLHVIPVINKIDLPHARPDEVAKEVGELLGDDPDRSLLSGHSAGRWRGPG